VRRTYPVAKTVAQGQWRVRLSVAGHARALEASLTLNAVAFPILPGKTAEWREFIAQLNGPRQDEFNESRRRAGVRERTFFQSTPMGDLVIVTLEGDDPSAAFGQMLSSTDEFTTWFIAQAKAFHGVDLLMPMPGSPSELVADTDRVAATAS
jgi:hypothetical protein